MGWSRGFLAQGLVFVRSLNVPNLGGRVSPPLRRRWLQAGILLPVEVPENELRPIRPDNVLPGGVALYDGRGGDETPLWLHEQRTIVFTNALTEREGELQRRPSPYADCSAPVLSPPAAQLWTSNSPASTVPAEPPPAGPRMLQSCPHACRAGQREHRGGQRGWALGKYKRDGSCQIEGVEQKQSGWQSVARSK